MIRTITVVWAGMKWQINYFLEGYSINIYILYKVTVIGNEL